MNNGMSQIILIVAMIVLMYFIVFLPQKRREKQHKAMVTSLKIGDKVITIGGINGTVSSIAEGICVIETSLENTKIQIETWAIKEVIVTELDKDQDKNKTDKAKDEKKIDVAKMGKEA